MRSRRMWLNRLGLQIITQSWFYDEKALITFIFACVVIYLFILKVREIYFEGNVKFAQHN